MVGGILALAVVEAGSGEDEPSDDAVEGCEDSAGLRYSGESFVELRFT
jgi:hypothetical protein